MEIIYAMIIAFSMTSEEGIEGNTMLEFTGFKSLEECELALDEIESTIPDGIESFAGMCYEVPSDA